MYSGRALLVSSDARRVVLEGTPTLAGSCCTLAETVRNLVTRVGVALPDAVAMVSANPARVAGIGSRVGRIAVGRRADLVMLRDDLSIDRVIVAGECVFDNA